MKTSPVETPRCPQKAPKRLPKGPQEAPRGSQEAPRGSQEAPKRPSRPILRPSRRHLGAILRHLGRSPAILLRRSAMAKNLQKQIEHIMFQGTPSAADSSYPHGFPLGVQYVAIRRLRRNAMAQNLQKHIHNHMSQSPPHKRRTTHIRMASHWACNMSPLGRAGAPALQAESGHPSVGRDKT